MKDIPGYEGLYAVTEDGKVWSYRRKIFLKPTPNNRGYLLVLLWKKRQVKGYLIHRLVAEAFIPNPEGLPQVNHKDEDKTNNCVDNLEWMSAKDNHNYGARNAKCRKPVYCVELDKTFDSAKIACEETGIDASAIGKVCRGERKTAKGYHWKFVS